MPIAAAVGGGLLLLIIIVVVVLKRRSRTPQAKARSVVAFENPMYETTKVQRNSTQVEPLYDHSVIAESGMYDEPSFLMKANKSNPIFNSNENLNATETDEFGQVIQALQQSNDLYDEPAALGSSDTDRISGIALSGLADAADDDYIHDESGYMDVQPSGSQEPDVPNDSSQIEQSETYGALHAVVDEPLESVTAQSEITMIQEPSFHFDLFSPEFAEEAELEATSQIRAIPDVEFSQEGPMGFSEDE